VADDFGVAGARVAYVHTLTFHFITDANVRVLSLRAA
jgi:hypothetical protein